MSHGRDQLFEALSGRLAAADPGQAWQELVAAGVPGFRVAEAHGGLGMTAGEAEPIMAALGEAGGATPFVETSVAAAGMIGRCPGKADRVLGELAKHGTICAVVGFDPRLRAELSAAESGGRWVLDGRAKMVLHAGTASTMLAIVPLGTRTGLFLVESGPQIAAKNYPTIDGRTASDIAFGGEPATLLSDDAEEVVAAALDEAQACIAVEGAAIMRRLVRDTVEYTRQRRQFGQALSEFQVIQHRLVDMHIQARRAAAIAQRAMEALEGSAAVRSRLVSAAKATVAVAGRHVGQQAVQLHGAMGMTEELPLSRFFKRLTAIENELGSADEHIARHALLRETG